jgi:hypothetical protein
MANLKRTSAISTVLGLATSNQKSLRPFGAALSSQPILTPVPLSRFLEVNELSLDEVKALCLELLAFQNMGFDSSKLLVMR